MKKLCVILLSLIWLVSASAQQKGAGRHYYQRPSRVIVTYGLNYPYYYRPYGFWDPYPPYYGYPHYYHESKLDLKIEDIRNDYKDRIWSVKQDKSLSGKEKRSEIRKLKNQRDEEILDAKRNYYKSRR